MNSEANNGRSHEVTPLTLLAVLTVLAALAALWAMQAVAVPVLFAVFIIALVLPLQEFLSRYVPFWIAVGTTFLVVVVTLLLFASALWWTLESAAGQFGAYAKNTEDFYSGFQSWAEGYGLSLPDRPMDNVTAGQIVSNVWALIGGVWGFVGALGMTLALVALGLPGAPPSAKNVRELEPSSRTPLETAHAIGHAIRIYTVWTAVTCAINGVLTWIALALLGVEFALLWGAIAFVLTVVPTIGALLSIVPPTLLAFVQFDGWILPLIVLGTLTAIQVVMGNIVEPALRSRSIRILPVVALLSLLLWSALIGISGTVLAIPLTAAVVIICREFESTKWIAVLLTEPGAESAKRTSARAPMREPVKQVR